METLTIKVKSEDYGEWEYELTQPHTFEEAVSLYAKEESESDPEKAKAGAMEWLRAGRKADINAQQWAAKRGTKTEEITVQGKKYRVPKELAAILAGGAAPVPASV